MTTASCNRRLTFGDGDSILKVRDSVSYSCVAVLTRRALLVQNQLTLSGMVEATPRSAPTVASEFAVAWGRRKADPYQSIRLSRLHVHQAYVGVTTMAGQSEDVAAIKKLSQDWSTGWDRSDTQALLSLFTDEPILLPQGQPAVIGKNAIRSLYQSLFEEFTVKGEGKVVEVEVSGDLGYFWSSYTLTATPKTGGDHIKGEGKSVFIVRRQDDNSWKIARLIDNSDREQAASE